MSFPPPEDPRWPYNVIGKPKDGDAEGDASGSEDGDDGQVIPFRPRRDPGPGRPPPKRPPPKRLQNGEPLVNLTPMVGWYAFIMLVVALLAMVPVGGDLLRQLAAGLTAAANGVVGNVGTIFLHRLFGQLLPLGTAFAFLPALGLLVALGQPLERGLGGRAFLIVLFGSLAAGALVLTALNVLFGLGLPGLPTWIAGLTGAVAARYWMGRGDPEAKALLQLATFVIIVFEVVLVAGLPLSQGALPTLSGIVGWGGHLVALVAGAFIGRRMPILFNPWAGDDGMGGPGARAAPY